MAAILEFEEKSTKPETRLTPSDVEIICRLLTDNTNRLDDKLDAWWKTQARLWSFSLVFVLIGGIILIGGMILGLIEFASRLAKLIQGISRLAGFLLVLLARFSLYPPFERMIAGMFSLTSKYDIRELTKQLERFLQTASQFAEHGRISKVQRMELDFRMREAEKKLAEAMYFFGKKA
jgi:hypothetical protein